MRPTACLLSLTLALTAAPALAADPEQAAVLSVVQGFFDAIGSADSAAMRAVMLPGGQFASVAVEPDGAVKLNRFGVDESFGRSINPGLNERMWSHQVMLRGPLATVTGPYEFRKDGVTTHCGVEVFTLIRQEGAWRIASLTWTREPQACPELKAR